MIKKIFGTFGTRMLNAICNFITLWFGTHYLGAEAWGVGGIVLLDVSLLLIGVELLAGPGLVYFTPRKSFRTLFEISYLWSAMVVAFYALVIYLTSLIQSDNNLEVIPEGYHGMVLLLVFIYSLHNFNLNTLLGKERVGTNNILFIIQFLTQMCSMLFYIFVMDIRNADAFVFSLLTGYIVSYLCGLTQIWQYLKDKGDDSVWGTIKEMLRFGTIIQLTNMVSMLNKRLSFLIIKGFWGDAHVGVYNAGSQVAESPKIVGQSIAMVQFSKISNLNDNDLASKITVQLLKTATILTAICMVIVCVIPTSVYSWVFTNNFAAMRSVMIALAPGMIFMSAHTVFCHFFSGVNLPKYNLYAALVGFVVTIPALYLLIPPFGMVGAGISVSITNLAIIIYQWIVFKKINKISAKELLVTKEDVKSLIAAIKSSI
ncbi:MAG: polysaccharide biosynthesis C-terminal domain-containing protein [Bacteroidales bacterium]|nr:polysaccharide biosynthesis C-terminal domain-containing protein [Bacteroidales bacterium]